jgi:UPF0042 nucleotide-binding protein
MDVSGLFPEFDDGIESEKALCLPLLGILIAKPSALTHQEINLFDQIRVAQKRYFLAPAMVKILSPILNISDRNIDTSGLSLHQLRDLVKNTIVPNSPGHMAILFESFGFKKGLPDASDFIFDVRCLPNPYWKQELRSLTGYDEGVIEFLESQVDVAAMLSDIIGFLTRWIPKFQANNRSYLTISIGCTGGQHRSVYIANRLQEYFSKEHSLVQVVHKELSA